jgi:hypothetical protein
MRVAVPIRAQVQDHCETRHEGLAPVENEQSYESESSRAGFPAVDGRRPSSAVWRIGCT